jgi:2-methylcitrate dehydratase PrpD
MADRVFYRADTGSAAKTGDGPATSAPAVEIVTKDGRTLYRKPDGVPGDRHNPASQAQLEAKFRDCVAFAAKPIAPDHVERLIELIGDLEHLEDVSEITQLLS